MYDYSEYARPPGTSCWTDMAHAMRHAERVLAFGPPGTGKFRHATSCNPKAESITLDADTTRGSLVETTLPGGGTSGQWTLIRGPFLRAFEGGYPIVVNELDRVGEGSGETVLHAMLDDRAIARWVLFSGKTVLPAEGYACYATMNGTPDMLPSALRDRFDACVFIDQPHPGLLDAIRMPALRKVSEAIFADTPSTWPVTPRQVLRMDGMIASGLPFDDAVRITVPETSLRDRFITMTATHHTE